MVANPNGPGGRASARYSSRFHVRGSRNCLGSFLRVGAERFIGLWNTGDEIVQHLGNHVRITFGGSKGLGHFFGGAGELSLGSLFGLLLRLWRPLLNRGPARV